jgi:hypothetical protein
MKKQEFSKTVEVVAKKAVHEATAPMISATKKERPLTVVLVGVAAVAVGRHLGVDVQEIVETTGLSMQDAAALAVASVWLLTGWLSDKRGIKDEQDKVTPR